MAWTLGLDTAWTPMACTPLGNVWIGHHFRHCLNTCGFDLLFVCSLAHPGTNTWMLDENTAL